MHRGPMVSPCCQIWGAQHAPRRDDVLPAAADAHAAAHTPPPAVGVCALHVLQHGARLHWLPHPAASPAAHRRARHGPCAVDRRICPEARTLDSPACGVAGGHRPPNGAFGGIYRNTSHAKLGDAGSKVLPPMPTGIKWTRGGVGTTKWAIRSNHGGG